MPEQIANRYQTYSGTHQVSGEGVPQAMWRKRKTNTTALPPVAHTLVDTATRQRTTKTRSEKWRGGERGTARLRIDTQHFSELRVESNDTLVPAFPFYGDRQLSQIYLTIAQPGTLRCANTGAVQQRQHRAIAQTDHRVRLGLSQ